LIKQQQNGLSPSKIRSSVAEYTWTRSASMLLDAYRAAWTDTSENIYKNKEEIQFVK
jgi:hypothetical protein